MYKLRIGREVFKTPDSPIILSIINSIPPKATASTKNLGNNLITDPTEVVWAKFLAEFEKLSI